MIVNDLCVCCHPLMRVKIPLLAGLSGLLLVWTIPSYAQTDGHSVQTKAVDDWKKKISSQLASKKEYPPAATAGGTAKIKFTVDRQGKLISRELLEGTGSDLLDAAALGMVERAAPFPVPPAEADDFTFTVPIVFSPRKLLPWAGGQSSKEWVEEQNRVNAKIHGICRGC